MIASKTVWTVKSGDNLPVIAAQVYGNPRLWRLIADANGILNPLRFPNQQDFGRLLLIPGQKS